MKLDASLAIAANPATAILAARNLRGVTIIPPGREADVLAPISIEALQCDAELLATLKRWGIQTVGQLAALPEIGVCERLGEEGIRLWRLARGRETRILDVTLPAVEYSARQVLDHSIEILEPLFFIVSAQLHELTQKLQRNGFAARCITLRLELERAGEFVRKIDLPFAMRDPKALLKQVQLSLEADSPTAAVIVVCVALDAIDPRVIQGGLFLAAAPEPEKVETLLARLRALVGSDRVGSPEILNTRRPDAYRLRPCAFEPSEIQVDSLKLRPIRLAFRRFRPPVAARVILSKGSPQRVSSARASGTVLRAAGPWRTSGEWWTETTWDRDEWDVVLEEGGVYRIYLAQDQWFLDGSYD